MNRIDEHIDNEIKDTRRAQNIQKGIDLLKEFQALDLLDGTNELKQGFMAMDVINIIKFLEEAKYG